MYAPGFPGRRIARLLSKNMSEAHKELHTSCTWMVFKTRIPSERNITGQCSLFIIEEMKDGLKISPGDNLFLLS
jgi:hypothetical protein